MSRYNFADDNLENDSKTRITNGDGISYSDASDEYDRDMLNHSQLMSTPHHTSFYTIRMWVDNVLNGHENISQYLFRIKNDTFRHFFMFELIHVT